MALATQQPQSRPRRFWTMARRESLVGYLFIAPQLVGIIVFVLIPLALVVYYSLHEWNVLAGTFTMPWIWWNSTAARYSVVGSTDRNGGRSLRYISR